MRFKFSLKNNSYIVKIINSNLFYRAWLTGTMTKKLIFF